MSIGRARETNQSHVSLSPKTSSVDAIRGCFSSSVRSDIFLCVNQKLKFPGGGRNGNVNLKTFLLFLENKAENHVKSHSFSASVFFYCCGWNIFPAMCCRVTWIGKNKIREKIILWICENGFENLINDFYCHSWTLRY